MQKKISIDHIVETIGPMNSVALSDAMHYLGLEGHQELTMHEERLLRAKKKKIVTSTKKLERKISRELTRKASRFVSNDD